MFFRKEKQIQKGAKKFDKLITGLIIWGAVASMVGLSKTNKGKEISQNVQEEGSHIAKKGLSILGRVLVGALNIFDKKNKK